MIQVLKWDFVKMEVIGFMIKYFKLKVKNIKFIQQVEIEYMSERVGE